MKNADYKLRLVSWEVTKGYNLRCIHCCVTATELSAPLDLPTNIRPELNKASLSVLPTQPSFERWRTSLSARHL